MIDQKIIDISADLFLKYGVKSISMDDISKAVGVSKKTIYENVANKAELISAVVTDFILKEKIEIDKIVNDSKDAIDEMFKIANHVLYFLRNIKPSLTYDLQKYYRASWQIIEQIHFGFIRSVIKTNIQRGIKEKVYRDSLNDEIISRLYLSSAKMMTQEDFFPLKEFNKAELYAEFISYHMFGILNEKGLKKYKNYKLNI